MMSFLTTQTTRDDLFGKTEYVTVNILPTIKEPPLSVTPGPPKYVIRYIYLKHRRKHL